LKYVFPFICGMTGSCIAGIISTAASVTASAIGVGGLPGILSIQPGSIAWFAICMCVAVAVPFVLTYGMGKRKGIDKEAEDEASKEEALEKARTEHKPVDFMAFLTGKTVAITEVPDATFAEKVLGDGIAIEPTDNILVSPVDAVVEQTIEGSNHAIGLIMDNGLELLMHIGIDTVAMNGDGFVIHVAEGDRVKAGQELISFDPEKIKAAGHPLTTIMVITNDSGYETFRFDAGINVKAAENVIAHAE
ncbi:MAG: PTS glucose transporter subunit IIA, partial [Synergistaceae bacterium]|nr:PTS glucose transporter subunit IIA [Synergistaceae bacterium]